MKNKEWFAERLEVLRANKSNLDSRLLAVATPRLVIDHCLQLERRAEELYDMAQRMRRSLDDDIAKKDELCCNCDACDAEILLCQFCLLRGESVSPQAYNRLLIRFLEERTK